MNHNTDKDWRGVDRVSKLGLSAGVCFLVAVVLLNTYEVIARYVFASPSAIMDEIMTYANIGIVFLALAYVWRNGGHISVGIVPDRLMEPWKSRLRLFFFRHIVYNSKFGHHSHLHPRI